MTRRRDPDPATGALSGASDSSAPGAAAPLERRDGQLRPEWFGRAATGEPVAPRRSEPPEAIARRLAALPAPLLREVTHYAEYLADRYATGLRPDGD